MYSIDNREESEKVEELTSLQNQVEEVRLQGRLGKQNYHQNTTKLFKPLTDTIKNTSENLTKTIMETSFKNNKTPENLNNKLLEVMKYSGTLASYLWSLLSQITNPQKANQFKLINDSDSNRVNDLLKHITITATL